MCGRLPRHLAIEQARHVARVRGKTLDGRLPPAHHQRARGQLLSLGLGDLVRLHHVAQHPVATLPRALGLLEGVEEIGRGNHGGQRGPFENAQRLDGSVEVPARGLGDSADGEALRLTPIDRVQVHLEDVLLAQQQVHAYGQGDFGDLAQQRALAAEEERANELLRDRASALADLAAPNVGDERARGAADVHAHVTIEASILRCQDRPLDDLGHALGRERPQHRATHRADRRGAHRVRASGRRPRRGASHCRDRPHRRPQTRRAVESPEPRRAGRRSSVCGGGPRPFDRRQHAASL